MLVNVSGRWFHRGISLPKTRWASNWSGLADSVAANLSEGFGRFFYKENRRLCYYSRGSLYETFTWIEKAHNRGLISESDYEALRRDLGVIVKMLNKYIGSLGRKGTTSEDILPPMTDDH